MYGAFLDMIYPHVLIPGIYLVENYPYIFGGRRFVAVKSAKQGNYTATQLSDHSEVIVNMESYSMQNHFQEP